MTEQAETPEWLRYFIKRPMQGLLLVTATVLFFVALVMFLDDVREIQKSHVSIEDSTNIIKYITDSVMVIVPTAIIFFFVGVLYTLEHGVFGPYIAWVTVAVGLILLMIAVVEKDPGVRLVFSNAGWVAFSAGFGFFAGVHVEKIRRSEPDGDDDTLADAGAPEKSPRRRRNGRRAKADKN
jgi:hypothetical protein